MHGKTAKRNSESGFTLIELMIVVTIIGILAAVAIPRYVNYMRSSQTAEVGNVGGIIVAAMQSYADSQSMSASAAASLFSGTTLVPGSPTTGTLASILPQLSVPSNSTFSYAISAIVATAGPSNGDVAFCVTATANSAAGVPGGLVLYSSAPALTTVSGKTSPSVQGGWSNRLYNVPYVTGATTLGSAVAGGYCTSAGAAAPTQS